MTQKRNDLDPDCPTALEQYLKLYDRYTAGEDVNAEELAEWEQLALEESWDEEDALEALGEEEETVKDPNSEQPTGPTDPRLPAFIPRYLLLSDERCPGCLNGYTRCTCMPLFRGVATSVKDICRKCLFAAPNCKCSPGVFEWNTYGADDALGAHGSAWTGAVGMKCRHAPTEIAVGPYKIYCASEHSIEKPEDYDWFVSMNGNLPGGTFFGQPLTVFDCYTQDFHAPDKEAFKTLLEYVWHEGLEKGKKIVVFCTGGHGRTGTFAAALIALVEQPEDPIEALRSRYCEHAVEGYEQRKAVFEVLGRELPEKYESAGPVTVRGFSGGQDKQDKQSWWKSQNWD